MKVIDSVKKIELDLSRDQMIDLVANQNRQLDLVFDHKRTDADGYLTWNRENWTCVGTRFVRSYFLDGRALSEFSGYNKYDLATDFNPEQAIEILLG